MSRSSCTPGPAFGTGDPLREASALVENATVAATAAATSWFNWVSGAEGATGDTKPAQPPSDGGAAAPPARAAPAPEGPATDNSGAEAPPDGKPKAVSSAAGALMRVKSFNSSPHADAWRSLPQKMGPVALVRLGWKAVRPEDRLLTVKCDTCSAELCVPDEPSWTALSLEAVRCVGGGCQLTHLQALAHLVLPPRRPSPYTHPPAVGPPQAVDEFAELMVSTHEETCPWRVSIASLAACQGPASHPLTRPVLCLPCSPCTQTHVFGDASIRLKDARSGGDDDARRRRVDPATAVSLDEQIEARRVGRMYVPEVDHDGF